MLLLPSAFLPYCHYFSLIVQEECAIYVGEMYQKQSYRNRTDLLSPNGVVSFSLPVQKIGYPSPDTSEVLLSPHGNWRHQLEKLLLSNYANTPYWFHYEERIMELIYDESVEELVLYNHKWLTFICDSLEISTPSIVYEMGDTDTFIPEIITTEYKNNLPTPKRYWQVFEHKFGFTPHLSILDLLLSLGPEARPYLRHSL